MNTQYLELLWEFLCPDLVWTPRLSLLEFYTPASRSTGVWLLCSVGLLSVASQQPRWAHWHPVSPQGGACELRVLVWVCGLEPYYSGTSC